jgi:hypothetical protein
MASPAICSGVIGRYGDMVGVWMDPVIAADMINFFGIKNPPLRVLSCRLFSQEKMT